MEYKKALSWLREEINQNRVNIDPRVVHYIIQYETIVTELIRENREVKAEIEILQLQVESLLSELDEEDNNMIWRV